MNTLGALFIVGTPIGNLEDMSPRAIRILKEADIIAAEDTRHTMKLLSRFDIHTPMESYHKFSEREKVSKFIGYLQGGKNVALVSNAGMPGISDPGEILIKEAIEKGIIVIPVPGPSAFLLALSASGLPTGRFVFEGFLPKKQGERIKRLYEIKDEKRTMIFYEAGERIEKTISDMRKIFGNRKCVIARELTKIFEEIKKANFDNIIGNLAELRGEFVIVAEGAVPAGEPPQISVREEIERLQKELGITAKEAIKLTAARFNLAKREVYGTWIRKDKD